MEVADIFRTHGAAWCAVKVDTTCRYLQLRGSDPGAASDNAQYHRIRARRGPKKAIVAVAASILTAIYHMLKDGTMYQDLGPNHFDAHAKERQKNRLIKRLADLGYAVELALLPN